MKNILMVNYEFPPLGGGAGQAHAALCREFALQQDLRVDVVTSGKGSGVETESMGEQVTIHRVGIRKENLHRWKRSEVLAWLWKARRPYQTLLRARTYDLVHAFFAFPSGWLCYRTRTQCPYILSLRGSDVPGQNARLQLEYKLLGPTVFKPIWRNAQHIVACSEGLKWRALRFLPGVDMSVIPNGVDLDLFQPAYTPREGTDLRLITVGRLSETKRVDLLIETVAELRQQGVKVTLTVIGGGGLMGRLRHLARECDATECVTFTDRQDREAMPDLYRRHDLYISATMQEGMSNAMLEAMASGLPIVTTRCEGLDELIDQNGLIVKESASALAHAVKSLAENPRQRADMSQAARAQAETFTWSAAAQRYLDLYRSLVQTEGVAT